MLTGLLNFLSCADQAMIAVFAAAQKPLPEAERLFSHILNAQHIWISRINNTEPVYDRFDLHPVRSFDYLMTLHVNELRNICNTRDLQEQVIYSNSRGDSFTNSIHDILFHVVNHSTYHRAQIATSFKQNGIEPPITDYIMLKREGKF